MFEGALALSAYEGRVNVALARLLERMGFKERAERRSRDRRRVDVILLHRGFRIALEGSYEAFDAERDARQRLESQLCDLAVAVWYDRQLLPQETMESEIEGALEKSTLRVRFFLPGEDVTGTLLSIFTEAKRLPPEPLVQGWLKVNVPLLGDLINQAIQHMVSEERVKEAEAEIKELVDNFCQSLGSADRDLKICGRLYESFYKLYGLSVGEPERIKDLIYGKTALAILLSAVFYEGIRAKHGVPPLRSLAAAEGELLALEDAFDRILEINYQPIFRVAREVVEALPPEAQPRIADLIELARKTASNRVLLRRDFAGKVYHAIVGDWAVRKNFATYFTSVPAAYLLARLALATPNPAWSSFSSLENIEKFRIADLACGSGTLLSASYEALLYLYTRDCLRAGPEADAEGFHKAALEKVFWGLDALRFAMHIAATTLALHNPEVPLQSMNLYTVPLGVNSEKTVSLGSLDLAHLRTLRDYFGGGTVMRVSTSTEEQATIKLPEGFDLIIMNPPFTRATGRGGREGGGLFGFVADESVRGQLLKSYGEFRESVKHKMVEVAETERFLKGFKAVLGEEGIRPFLGVGQAGEGLLFLHVASKSIAEGGRIAFVLPRSLLSGVGWFLARTLLASKFHLEYVVVSYDSRGGYNFSESTALSECLIVARKTRERSENERTCIVALLKKPSSALEGVWLAHEIIEKYGEADEIDVTKGYHAGNYVKAGACGGVVYTVPRQLLLKHLDNWGKLLAFTNPRLSIYALKLLEGKIGFGNVEMNVPIKRLGEIAAVGIDRHQFHDSFQKVEGAPSALPCLYGGEEDVRSRLQAEPNAQILPRNEKARKIFERFASELLVPDRIWFDTAHVTSIYVAQPVLSNIFYAVKLKTKSSSRRLKALCAWLNSTWGIMAVLACRQETRGAWISLKMSHWRLLPVLEVTALPYGKIEALSKAFDRFKDAELKRLPEQYSSCQEERLSLDVEVLKALEPSVNEEEARNKLMDLYVDLSDALKNWIG